MRRGGQTAWLEQDLSEEQRQVWERVEELWRLAVRKDTAAIEAALHPRYRGWEAGSATPHDREFAVRSVTGPGEITHYALEPHSVQVYDAVVGVAHYSYTADTLVNGAATAVAGRWTEVYVRHEREWLLIAVCGGPA